MYDTENKDQKSLLTLGQAADLLGFTEEEVRLRAEVGRIKFEKRVDNDYWFTMDALKAYVRVRWWDMYRWAVAAGLVIALVLAGIAAYYAVQYQKRAHSGQWVEQARDRLAQGDTDSALKLLKATVEINPRNSEARLEYARVLGLAGKPEEQEAQLREALRRGPGSVRALEGLGVVQIEGKRWYEAQQTFGGILRQNPDHFMAMYYLAMIYSKSNEWDKAAPLLKKILKKRPGFAPAQLLLADAFAKQSKWDDALKMYRKNQKADLASILNQGIIYQKQGKQEYADAVYDRIISNGPILARAYNNKAWSLIADEAGVRPEDLEKAFGLARMAYMLNPGDATAADTLGWIFYLSNRNKEALQLFDEAISLSPDLAAAHFHKARTLMRTGKRTQALQEFREAKKHAARSSEISVLAVDAFIHELTPQKTKDGKK